MKPRLVPFAGANDSFDRVDGVEHIDKANVERSEAEPHDVGRAEVADHAVCDQRLDDRIAVDMAQRNLAATLARVARRFDGDAEPVEARVDEANEEVAESHALRPQCADAYIVEGLERRFERAEREHRRRTALHAFDARSRRVIVGEGEWFSVAEPAAQRLPNPV